MGYTIFGILGFAFIRDKWEQFVKYQNTLARGKAPEAKRPSALIWIMAIFSIGIVWFLVVWLLLSN